MTDKQIFDMKSNESQSDDKQKTNHREIVGNSSSENPDTDSTDTHQPPTRKRYHRYTSFQIQRLEAVFNECPHPDDKQRKELSSELGMEPLQVKFWFQNKRSQRKTQHEHQENAQLRLENEKLIAENMRYREVLDNASCLACGGPTIIGEMSLGEQQLRTENARLRAEIDRISALATNYVGKPFTDSAVVPSSSTQLSPYLATSENLRETLNLSREICRDANLDRTMNSGLQNEGEKSVIIKMAAAAMEELMRMAQLGEPLWGPGMDPNSTSLNVEEYKRMFLRGLGPVETGFKVEASRENVIVVMSSPDIVEMLMDMNQWSSAFSGIVSRATNLQVVSSGVGESYHGSLQVMNVELQVPSPLVRTRECYLVRYCKQHVDGTWAVVDVSLDHLLHTSAIRFLRRPSGCVIKDMHNGCSKVTWVEHVEVEDRGIHNIYKPLVNAGLAFGAKRWVAILEGQCERIARAVTTDIPPNDMNITYLGRKCMLKLAERMVASFCRGVSASTANPWTNLPGNGVHDNVKVMTRNANDPDVSSKVHLTAASSFWLPFPPKTIFNYLQNENYRKEWDMLFSGSELQVKAHFPSGKEPGNHVTLYQVKSAGSGHSNSNFMLQESRTDPTASYVVYTPVDMAAVNLILGGGDPNCVDLLPSGFVILPDGPIGGHGGGTASTDADSGGSLLTVAFQVVGDPGPNAKFSPGLVAAINNLITCTVDNLKKAFSKIFISA